MQNRSYVIGTILLIFLGIGVVTGGGCWMKGLS